jgi:hypothetical protein
MTGCEAEVNQRAFCWRSSLPKSQVGGARDEAEHPEFELVQLPTSVPWGSAGEESCANVAVPSNFRSEPQRPYVRLSAARVLPASVFGTVPDPGSHRRPILELFDRRDARQAVPDGQQPLRRPTGHQLCQFLLAGEGIKPGSRRAGRLFRRAMRRNVALGVYGESCHIRFP